MSLKKYIYLHNFTYSAGLNDLKDRFTEYLKISKILNLIPILPTIYLTDFHTKKQNNLLTDYIEVPEFVCKTMPSNIEEIYFWSPTNQFIPNDMFYIKYRKEIENYKLNVEFLQKYKIIANQIVEQMQRPICVVHVRRGDYFGRCPSLKYTTTPSNIKNVLQKHKFNVCYIKTNEPNLDFFSELKNYFNIKFFYDFNILKEIYDSGDNYALYSIECCIRNLADIKISTFNTTNSESCWLPNNDPNFFNDYLDENKGYQ